jgi:hypothetical protein
VACCLLVVTVLAFPVAAAAPTGVADGHRSGNATAAVTATVDGTAVASDDTFGGFTLGAALLAVIVAGSYRYLRD